MKYYINTIKKEDRHTFFDLLKGICILCVIITHGNWSDRERLTYFFPFWIDMAVPCFMVISGYLYAESYKRHFIVNLEKAYAVPNILYRILRFSVPFTMLFIVQETINVFSGESYGVFQICCSFLTGGRGPGSYYYPLMIQFIFIFPVIFFLIERYGTKGVLICGLLNIIYELLKTAYGMNESCYRLLLFRYLFLISFGCILFIKKDFSGGGWKSLICFITGFSFIVIYKYFGYSPMILSFWTGTSFLACLYIMPLLRLLIQNVRIKCKPIEMIGKASFNIYLVQMSYFYNDDNILGCHAMKKGFIQLMVNVIVCVVFGCVFYYVERPITKFITKRFYIILNM